MSSSWMVVAWRRVLLTGIATLTALLVISHAAPSDARAAVPAPVTSQYAGWAYVKSGPKVCAYGSYRCGTAPATAWHWDGRSWSRQSLAAGTRVYAYPYAGSWHWAWTQRTGWLAVQSAALERRCGYGWAVPCS